MAEENKSFFPNIGILSSSALEGLTPDVQDQLQREATKRIALGGLLSGGNFGMAFQSAVGTPNDYMQNQSRLMEIQKIQRQNAETEDFYSRNLPNVPQAGQRALAGQAIAGGRLGPTVEAGQAQRAILNAPIDFQSIYKDIARLGSNPAAANIREAVGKLEPKVGEGGLRTGPGGQYLGNVPTFSPTQGIVYGTETDAQGRFVPFSQEIPGAVNTRGRMAGAETRAREENTYRPITTPAGAASYAFPSEIRGGAIGGAGGVGGAGVGTGTGGITQTASDIAKNKAAEADYLKFSEKISENAQTAPTRRQAAEFLYSAADKMDPNVATPFFAQTAGYLRVIPGVGDKYDSFVGDYKLMNQTRANKILEGFQSIKGNANPQEVNIAKDAANNPVEDPKWTTKWLSALEVAVADKDAAKEDWKSTYQGDTRRAVTEWEKSPQNPRIYNHPKVERFLTEQFNEWAAKGDKRPESGPILPAGFVGGMSKDGSSFKIKKPDGSIMTIGAR